MNNKEMKEALNLADAVAEMVSSQTSSTTESTAILKAASCLIVAASERQYYSGLRESEQAKK